jgi:proline iminopeptidase
MRISLRDVSLFRHAPPAYTMTLMPRGDLFPEIGPFETGYLPLSGGHVMYWEQVGNPNGRPVLFLHGGPGAGAGAVHRRFFDPGFWRVVIFDQRGAGRSRPLGSLARNTTPDLVEDIETLRHHLAIDRWLLFGGSWGSTLALAYAQAHPTRIVGAVLRGIFLGRQQEVEWFLYGTAAIFPDAHAAFAGFLPEAERGDLLGNYLRRLIDPDPAVHGPAARAWSVYEGSCSTLLPSPETVASFAQDRTALGLARIEAYYFAHDLFLPPGGLLAHMDQIAHIPAEIVQGRYDMVCPARTAFDLAAAWPAARLSVVPDAGHSALEPGIRRALIAAVERFRDGR